MSEKGTSDVRELLDEAERDIKDIAKENGKKPWYKRLSLTTWIFIALVLGVMCGLLLQGNPGFADTYIKPIGTIFLNLIKMIVVPLVIVSMMAGVISLKDIKRIGAIGGKTIVFYLFTTGFAVCIGLLFANVMHVGGGLNTRRRKPLRSSTPS